MLQKIDSKAMLYEAHATKDVPRRHNEGTVSGNIRKYLPNLSY